MSWVTNVLLSVSVFDARQSGALDHLQQRLIEIGIGPLGCINDTRESSERRWGGTKGAEVSLYGAGYNFFVPEPFLDAALKTPWKHPWCVQLFIMDQETFLFSVLEIDWLNDRWTIALDRLAEIDMGTGERMSTSAPNRIEEAVSRLAR